MGIAVENFIIDYLRFAVPKQFFEDSFESMELAHFLEWLDKNFKGEEDTGRFLVQYWGRKHYPEVGITIFESDEEYLFSLSSSGLGLVDVFIRSEYERSWVDVKHFLRYLWGIDGVRFTRVDIAVDVKGERAKFVRDKLFEAIREGQYTSLAKRRKAVIDLNDQSRGFTFYLGSPHSERMLRIYDKATELGLSNEEWIRFELQCKDTYALGLMELIVNEEWDLIRSMFVDMFAPREGSNSVVRNNPVAEWYSEIFGSLRRAVSYVINRTRDRLRWFFNIARALNSVRKYIDDHYGVGAFLDFIRLSEDEHAGRINSLRVPALIYLD